MPFERENHWSPVIQLTKGQWCTTYIIFDVTLNKLWNKMVKLTVIYDAMLLMWCHCNAGSLLNQICK